jgi:hypothetical protein
MVPLLLLLNRTPALPSDPTVFSIPVVACDLAVTGVPAINGVPSIFCVP